LKLGNSYISNFSNEPEAYKIAKTDFSEVICLVLSIFEEKFQIESHFEFFSRPFFQKKWSRKVNSQKRHYLIKRIFMFCQRFSKWRIFSKWLNNWFFENNSVSFDFFLRSVL
jgi:hypothetical protein